MEVLKPVITAILSLAGVVIGEVCNTISYALRNHASN